MRKALPAGVAGPDLARRVYAQAREPRAQSKQVQAFPLSFLNEKRRAGARRAAVGFDAPPPPLQIAPMSGRPCLRPMAVGASRTVVLLVGVIVALAALLGLSQLRVDERRREADEARSSLLAEQRRSKRLRAKSVRLADLLKVIPAEGEAGRPGPPCPAPDGVVSGESGGIGNLSEAAILLQAHARWDWKAIAKDFLQPWPNIEREQLDTAVEACNDNGTMYCQRLQVHNGQLYLTDYRAIFFDRKYAPARVMPLLAALRRHPDMPDVDMVVAGNDEPRAPAIPGDRASWTKMVRHH